MLSGRIASSQVAIWKHLNQHMVVHFRGKADDLLAGFGASQDSGMETRSVLGDKE
jgi:hypothetical protein